MLTDVRDRPRCGIVSRRARIGFVGIEDAHARLAGIMREHRVAEGYGWRRLLCEATDNGKWEQLAIGAIAGAERSQSAAELAPIRHLWLCRYGVVEPLLKVAR